MLRAIAGACIAWAAAGAFAPARAADACAAPDDLTADVAPLPHTQAVIDQHGTLDVLTVGSATVFSPVESLQPGTVTGLALGIGNGPRTGQPNTSEAAFPIQMAHDLERGVPGLKVNVTTKGGRGMLATDMLDILRTEMAAHHYQLVIWQTGTVEAVHNVPAGDFYQTLSDGASLLAGHDADLILVDPQFSRFLRANTDIEPYMQALSQVAAQPDVMLFHRFDLMRYWAMEGRIDLERTAKAQRVSTVEALHACLGQKLADMLLQAIHTAP